MSTPLITADDLAKWNYRQPFTHKGVLYWPCPNCGDHDHITWYDLLDGRVLECAGCGEKYTLTIHQEVST